MANNLYIGDLLTMDLEAMRGLKLVAHMDLDIRPHQKEENKFCTFVCRGLLNKSLRTMFGLAK